MVVTDPHSLVEGLRTRDTAAQQRFWRTFFERTYLICMRIIGKEPEATDVATDLMLDFVDRHVLHLSDPRAVWSYLRLMAIRQSLDAKKRWEKAAPLDFDIEDMDSDTPESRAIVARLTPQLKTCLSHLTPKARQALRLKFTGEMTHEEIGHRIGGTKQYIGRLIRKSLEALRQCLDNHRSVASTGEGHDMTIHESVVTAETVAQLLSRRKRHTAPTRADHLARMAEVIAGCGDNDAARTVDVHLSTCESCREVLRHLAVLDAPETPSLTKPRKAARSIRAVAALAASVLLAVGISYQVLQTPDQPGPSDDPSMRIKGFEDRLSITVKRNNTQFAFTPDDNLEINDRLAFSYAAEREGYLMIFSRDAAGRTNLLHPKDTTTSAKIFAGERIALPDGAVVDTGEGCEWIVAVFSDTPLEWTNVSRAAKNGATTGRGCGIEMEVPGARSVSVTPVRR